MYAIEITNLGKKFRLPLRYRGITSIKDLFLKTNWWKRDNGNIFYALKDINLKVKKGETLGIIGRNGAGKTTLLKIIAKILSYEEGNIIINGTVGALLELGAGFHPEFTGRENIFINAMILGLSKNQIKEKFDEIVRFAEMEKFIDAPVKSYSSGMFMRLGFSIAVNINPDILLVDEVLAVGDEAFSQKCKLKMSEFKKNGKTIIFVSHDLPTVQQWCDRVLWLDTGRITDIGDPVKIINQYKDFLLLSENLNLQRISSENRWGSNEIKITDVKLLDKSNNEKNIFSPEEPIKININYQNISKIIEGVFGFSIYRDDGICCYNTSIDFKLKGEGKIICEIPEIQLCDGGYFLDVYIKRNDGYDYDYLRKIITFKVLSDKKDLGIVRFKHRWLTF